MKAGRFRAATDVFPVEPRTNKDEFQSPLRGLDNVILTPHIGGSTMEAQANIGLEVAEKLCDKVAIIQGGRLIRSGTMEEVKGDDSLEEVFLELEAE